MSMAHQEAIPLRDLPAIARFFWKGAQPEQYHTGATDVDSHGYTFELYKNTVAAMALNEYAAQAGQGFFYFLRSRLAWKRKTESVCPESRLRGQPGPDYPGLLYINYTWTISARDRFVRSSQRSRYLACDALINPPAGACPLYAIQYAFNKTYPVYITRKKTLIVLATPASFYFGSSSDIEKAIGRWSDRSYKPPDADHRLNTTPFLWTEASTVSEEHATARNNKTGKRSKAEIVGALAPFAMKGIPALYEAIIRTCRPDTIAATCTFRELRSVIPRPLEPEAGVALGTTFGALGADWESSNPRTRRGARFPTRGDKHRVGYGGRGTCKDMEDGSSENPWRVD